MKSQRGFTLMEMMIVVGIVGMLASMAVPTYQEYVARAQVAEAIELVSAARVEVTEHYVNSGAWPTAVAVMQAPTRYTSGIALSVGAGSTEPVATLTARVKSTGVQRDISGKAIDLITQDGGATWACHSDEIAANLLPRACRG